jgi:hypothetical protein
MKPATQPDRGRCSWCGGPCRWIATDSPWEFDLICPAGCRSVLSWAHADPPPHFEADVTAGEQAVLFP